MRVRAIATWNLRCEDQANKDRHTFCRKCILQALDVSLKCPVDRNPLNGEDDLQPAPLLISNLINDLVVQCPNKVKGCNHQCHRWLVDRHVLCDCLYTEFECGGLKEDGSSCREPLEKRFIYAARELVLGQSPTPESEIEHESSNTQNISDEPRAGPEKPPLCPHILIDCPNDCGITFSHYQLDDHIQKDCPNVQEECPVCREVMSRSKLPNHLNVCPEMIVPCSSSEFGCVWVGKRHILKNEHSRTCRFVAFAPALTKQNNRISTLEQENKVLRQKLDRVLAFMTTSDTQTTVSHPSTTPSPNNTTPTTPARTTNFTDSDFMQLFLEGERFREEIERVNTQIKEMDMRHGMSQLQESYRTGEEISNLRALINSLRNQMHFLMTERRLSAINQQQPFLNASAVSFPVQPSHAMNQASPELEGSITPPFNRLLNPRRLSDISRQDVKL